MNSLPLYTILPGKPLLTNSAYYLYCRVKKGKLAVLDAKSLSTTVVSQRSVTSAIITLEDILSPVKKSKH